ncbi:hypothetical protein SME46J_49800 (plasmid) [Serratia marcescens]|nr:hypothetical protein SME46J_49800 [Serratia marcescens]
MRNDHCVPVKFTVRDCDYADHGVEFQVVNFTTRAGLCAHTIESGIRKLPGCQELVDFDYDRGYGLGGFILIPGSVEDGHYEISLLSDELR